MKKLRCFSLMFCLILAISILCNPAAVAATKSKSTKMTIAQMKTEVVRQTNAARVKAGLPKLKTLPALMDCAQTKAEDFIINGYYGHTSPVYGTSGKMIKKAVPKAKASGENIAPWRKTPTDVMTDWLASPGHRAIILSKKYTHIGVGIVKGKDGGYWWVCQFVKL